MQRGRAAGAAAAEQLAAAEVPEAGVTSPAAQRAAGAAAAAGETPARVPRASSPVTVGTALKPRLEPRIDPSDVNAILVHTFAAQQASAHEPGVVKTLFQVKDEAALLIGGAPRVSAVSAPAADATPAQTTPTSWR